MMIGDAPATPMEEALRRVQVQPTVSRRFRIDPAWRYDLQSPFWRLYVHNRSGGFILHAGRRWPLASGYIHLIPAWVRFQSLAVRAVVQDYLHFYVTGLPPSLLRRVFDRPLRLRRDAVLADLVGRWQRHLEAPSGFAPFGWASVLANAAFTSAVMELAGSAQGNWLHALAGFGPVAPALGSIDQNLAQPPANAELARLCGLSTDHFIRQFRRMIGMTPAQYGLERRLSLAAQWLTSTHLTLEEIADRTGFTDRFHFSRAFKARLGLPPATYRRLHRSAPISSPEKSRRELGKGKLLRSFPAR